MRLFPVLIAATLLFCSASAGATEPPSGLAFFSGAAIEAAGFLVGGTLLGTSRGRNAPNTIGWLTIESGFVAAPLAAHGAVGEWGRGAVFASVPAAAMAASGAIFADAPSAVERGTLPQQRWMWSLFGVGLLSSAAGIVDATFASVRVRARGVVVQPAVGAGQVGIRMAGVL